MGTVRAAGVGNVTSELQDFDVSVSQGNLACCRRVSSTPSRRDRAAAVARRRGSVSVRYGSGGTPPPNGHAFDPTRGLRRVERVFASVENRWKQVRCCEGRTRSLLLEAVVDCSIMWRRVSRSPPQEPSAARRRDVFLQDTTPCSPIGFGPATRGLDRV